MARYRDVQPVKPFSTFTFLCAAAAFGALGACQQANTPEPAESTAGAAGPDARPGIAVSDGRLVLPVVAGRPAAIYFSVRNDGNDSATLAGIHVAGAATAEMHKTENGTMTAIKTLDIGAGKTIAFAPGGYHVMAFDLADSLAPGEATELTLTFSDGDKISMPLRIERMGGDMEDHGDKPDHGMEGMHH